MSEAPGNPPSSKRPALPWLLLAAFALVLALALDRFMAWAIMFFPEQALPEAFLLVFNLRKFLFLFPGVFAVIGWCATRWPWLRIPWTLVTASIVLASIHLVMCYGVMLVGVAMAGGMVPRRLPLEVRNMIEQSERLELLSILPGRGTKEKPPYPVVGEFHGYPLLGRLTVTNPIVHQEVVKEFLASIDKSNGSKALCFQPRHAIRLKRGSGELDLLVCYECRYIIAQRGSEQWEVGVSSSSKALLNQLLIQAGIPLAPEEGGVVVTKPATTK